MAGFNIPTRMTQELLAPIAAAGFRPPQAMAPPGLNVPTAGWSIGALERSPQIGCVRQGA